MAPPTNAGNPCRAGGRHDAIEPGASRSETSGPGSTRERRVLRQYLDLAGMLFAVVDTGGTIIFVNRTACEVLGYPEPEIVGRNWFDTLLPADVQAPARRAFAQLMAGDVEPVEHAEELARETRED